ncbi:hypothetical protein DSL72_004813 [Monilinia vaccinii-corymbosi]|uniref:Major facilitator superfamily (MFS) profile domain-containing protein n=1 Tax=Monilinia vaccinii-corymbosi TaxID=61207 RepID=A0A8A3P5D9_9HELO|nr:hypothetical protein DSL72_004813 [Monilinia vaccinii-corymbosi]
MVMRHLHSIIAELGLITLYKSPFDTKLLCLQRFTRMFAYATATLILVEYLSALHVSKTEIGLFMTLTLVGDTVISFGLTLFADALGRKATLAVGSGLMMGSGIVFALCENYWGLLAAAVLGVISPSGNEIGPFRAIEESTLAQLTPASNRSDIYAWYSLLGTAGQACGFVASGWVISYLRNESGWADISIYRAVFWGYAIFGFIKLLLSIGLSQAVEVEKKDAPIEDPETAPLLGGGAENGVAVKKAYLTSRLPDISKESRLVVFNLCLLLGLDSFASGLVPLSWVTYFFHEKFGIEAGKLGSLFFTTSIISAGSMLVASSLSKRLGNVKTMVFTHLPSSIFLSLIPVPSTLPLAIAFLILRHCTSSMDQAPRTAFIAAVVHPHERTAVMGLVNVVKTCAQSLGPVITGVLAGRNLFWVVFVSAGALKASYDLGLLGIFAGHKTREDRAEEERRALEVEARAAVGRSAEAGL